MGPKVLQFAPTAPAPVIPETNLGRLTDDLQVIALLRPEMLHIVASVAKQIADPVRHQLKSGPMF